MKKDILIKDSDLYSSFSTLCRTEHMEELRSITTEGGHMYHEWAITGKTLELPIRILHFASGGQGALFEKNRPLDPHKNFLLILNSRAFVSLPENNKRLF